MSVAINHCIGGMLTPLNIGLIGLVIGLILFCRARASLLRSVGKWVVGFGVLWLWLWSTGGLYAVLGRHLERQFPPKLVEEYAVADAILVLGGGVTAETNAYAYAELNQSADRVWQAARLWKAGKAPIIVCSGFGTRESTVPFLCDLGIPEEKIVCLTASNTEDEARRIADIVSKHRILLVTSVWHMRRAKLLFEQHSGCEIIPAPCDYECLVSVGENMEIDWRCVLPGAAALNQNSILFKEYFAYWCYRLKFFLRGLWERP